MARQVSSHARVALPRKPRAVGNTLKRRPVSPIVRGCLSLSVIGLLPGLAVPAQAQAAPAATSLGAAQCEALVQANFSQVEDAPGKVIAARIVDGGGDLSAYCEVTGYAWRNVQFRVRMPAAGWNGKLVVVGTAGQAGAFAPDDPQSPVSPSGTALRKGYAVAAHNGGHVSGEIDALWAANNDAAMLDYGFRAPHAAGVIARAVVRQSYGRAATRVYYNGCSNGGREALHMAQDYPHDYDGIIAGAPSMNWSNLFVNLHWFGSRMYGSKAVLDASALGLLHRYVLKQCDRIDGKTDGILDDPRKCAVELAPITCRPGMNGPCLTPDQAKVAREIYDGPRDAAGRQIATSSAMPGSELVWDDFRGIEHYPPSVFRFQSFTPAAGPDLVVDDAGLADVIRRSGGSDAILSATNPDLRRFRDRGGKLLSFMGWNDPLGGIRETLDYHATVERVMGGRDATMDFYRLFMVPGMNHCTGGDGAYQVDWLAALDAWVEGQKEPDSVSGYHPDAEGKPAFVRPVTPHQSDNRF